MSAIITNKLRIFNAQQFIESVNEQTALWATGVAYSEGQVVLHASNLYVAVSDGTSGATAPTHVTGVTSDGGVDWAFYNKSIFNNIYMGIGKHTAWSDDTNPPTPVDSTKEHNEAKNALTALKKVGADTITLAVPRINWTLNTRYSMYTNELGEEVIPNSYVLTEASNQYNVYKVINCKKFVDASQGVQPVPSTVKPTGTSNEILETADGYAWKFMYSIQLEQALKFLTKDYFPVKYITSEPSDNTSAEYGQWTVQQSALSTPNSIDWVDIIDDNQNSGHSGGSGYNASINESSVTPGEGSTTVTLTITGAAQIANATNNDYTNYALVYTKDGAATANQRKITGWSFNAGTNVATITIDSAFAAGEGDGTGSIIIAPNVVLTAGDGTGFAAYALLQGDQVSKVVITDGGNGYTHATGEVQGNVAADAVTAAKVTPIISPTNGHGFNPVEELNGYYAMVSLKLEYDEQETRNSVLKSVFPVTGATSTFRQVVILTDPIDATTNNIAGQSKYRGPANADFGDGATDFNIVGGTGKVLYIENRHPISRAIDQIEDIKVVFEF